MRLFDRRPERRATQAAEDIIAFARGQRFGGVGTAGQPVTERTAMQAMAVWRCRHLIADICAGLPIEEFSQPGRTDGVGSGADRTRVPLSDFVRRPSGLVEPEEWRYQLVLEATGWGNGLAVVSELGANGWPRRAETVDWREVEVAQTGQFAPPTYKVNGELVDNSRVIHLRAYGPKAGSVLGMSPIGYAASAIGLNLAVRDFGASWYESGGHPTTLLTTDADLDDTTALAAKDKFREATRGDHIAVLGNSWDLKSVQVAPDDALFLNATNATAVDICGFYGIPAELLGYASQGGGSLTYANREQRALDLLVFTIQWWIGRLEKLISRQLPQPRFVKINVDGLLRSDALTRWTIHDKAVRLGARSIDEVRMAEDQQPLPDAAGDQFVWPPQGVTVTQPPMEGA